MVMVEADVIQSSEVLRRNLKKSIVVWYRGDRVSCKANKSVLGATQGLVNTTWKGTMLFSAVHGEELDMIDYRHIVDWLTCADIHGTWSRLCDGHPFDAAVSGRYRCVKVNCVGDMETLRLGNFTQVSLPKCHPAGHGEPLKLSGQIGIPFSAWKLNLNPVWLDTSEWERKAGNPMGNRLLKQEIDFVLVRPRTYPPEQARQWIERRGTLVLQRADQGDLLEEHVEALCEFAKAFEKKICVERLEGMALKGLFGDYFRWYRERKAKQDPRWKGVASPYSKS